MLDGFAISGYRSFGNDQVKINDLQRVNVFIGKNNCGKSNVLRFINLLPPFLNPSKQNEPRPKLDNMLDFSMNTTSKKVMCGIQIKKGGFTDSIFQSIAKPFGNLWTTVFPDNANSMWLQFQLTGNGPADEQSIEALASQILQKCNSYQQQDLTRELCKYTGGDPNQRAHDIAVAIHTKVRLSMSAHMIDAFRRITNGDGNPLSGAGLIKELRKLQSPELSQYTSGKARFSKIVGFLRSILGEPTAKIEIPAEKDEIYVTLNEKVLPLDSLGTGIHELIIIAAAVTLTDNTIFCIEEPEIHIHPELQKKFIEFINKNTSNQYLITSHSNSFFDLPGVNIYRCWLEEGTTKCLLASEDRDKHALLRDLGYRPSDLLQANYVIWVEGPSDRIYLKHWIQTKAPDLIEGLHYTIMFYGGRLLSHLSYDHPEVSDFVKLARLNRSACIVIDSDKEKSHGRINKTKHRVKEDFERNSCMTWVTNGRSIENYIPESVFNNAVATVHPKTKRNIKWSRFGDFTRLRTDKVIDKVSVARAVSQAKPDFSILDLNAVLDRLIGEIRKSNKLTAIKAQN
ncbi:MAG: AAA family ATPase [Thermodesulfobacteriota bacterium]